MEQKLNIIFQKKKKKKLTGVNNFSYILSNISFTKDKIPGTCSVSS